MAVSLNALVVDDEQPVLDELVWLLGRDVRITSVRAARSGAEALRMLEAGDIDLVFLDVAMPGLSGLDIARLLGRFATPPRIVFVTAHDQHAVEAFEMNAVDYLLKPIREERLRESVRRACADTDSPAPETQDSIAVELGGVTRFVSRRSVSYVEASGDYVRLHTADGPGHLVRVPIGTLADDWSDAGFVRIHRSHVVNLAHVREVRINGGRCSVLVPVGDDLVELVVARRHTRTLREMLHERAL
ncbi:DNA-binding response regulator [Aeromicrobium sp. A1-2]|uniref:LytR/AlgR family response regulator transcription factor n=1 Tax=Aeromicrobium sp. A1-2 TaxID=2107713 RepID=UPI000E50BC85|nr:LytTR family DNA-binding domain-containing protein [Aeromicrobium sp. A1-2]AXT86232.1 DNA-binding response regulator [Aeromicrobium sp. A1-2]